MLLPILLNLLISVNSLIACMHPLLLLLADFFTTAVHARFQYIVAAMVTVFISSFLFWACIYYAIWK